MPRDAAMEARLRDLTPAAAARALEGLGEKIAESLHQVEDPAQRLELEKCLEGVRNVCSNLHTMSLLFDPERAAAAAKREEDLQNMVVKMSNSINELAMANRELAQETGKNVRELDAISKLPPGAEFAKQAREAVGRVRQTASKMEAELEAAAAGAESAGEQVQSLQRQLHEAREKARCDALTRVQSRAALDELLRDALAKGEQDGPWSVMIADVDHFKAVNDSYGHIVGDALLYRLARLLESSLADAAPEGTVARYGGEEFAILLPHAVLEDAGEVADRIRSTVASTRWEYRGSPGRPQLGATVSIGVAQFRAGDNAVSLLNRADQALYRAKKGGRNQVVLEPK